MLIALIGIIHVIINHGLAVGFFPLITLLEYLGYRKRKYNLEFADQWDKLTEKMMLVAFVITTSLGALTGVGIWFSTSLVNPDAIGSLIRVFYGAWFSEWFIFITELVLVLIYFLNWNKSNQSQQTKIRHIRFGAFLSIFSWSAMIIISGILGFMMNPSNWLTKKTFLNGFTNANFIPQLYFRTPLAMVTAGTFAMFLALLFTEKGNKVREKIVSFISLWILVWTPMATAGAFLYWAVIPEKLYVNFPTAITTMAFVKWYNSLIYIILGFIVVTLLIAAWGFLKPKRLIGAVLIVPLLVMFICISTFERAREFVRKPYVVGEYLYANSLQVKDYPHYKKEGILPHATYVSTPIITEENKIEAGQNVFMIACSRCHTVTGINSVVKKFKKMNKPGEPLNPDSMKQFILKMNDIHVYMPPFPGNEKEIDAFTVFVLEMDKTSQSSPGAQEVGTAISPLHVEKGSLVLTPVPKDIPLEFPFPKWILVFFIIVTFLLHILFVTLMLGGSIVAFWSERRFIIRGEQKYQILAREIANTVTVNKSLAIVLGVGPLLTINVLYTLFFYSSNALTGYLWISIVILVSTAFLLLYYHKYTWEKYKDKKLFHISLSGAAVLLMLFIPFIFLTNINLMLFPEKWGIIKGFFSAMFLANVIPRYLHFLVASLAITGLFLFWYMGRKQYPFESIFGAGTFSRLQILRRWYGLALFPTLAQLGFGPLNLLTLPRHAVTWYLVVIFLTGASFAITAMILIWSELKGPDEELGKRFYLIVIILTTTIMFMGTGRHVYRANAISPHWKQIQQRTMSSMIISDRGSPGKTQKSVPLK